MAGLTPNGLVIRTRPELVALITMTILEAAPDLVLDPVGPEQTIIEAAATYVGEGWDTLQQLYDVLQGRGSGLMLDLIAALTGTRRRPATRTRVLATVRLDLGATLPAGKVAAVDGKPDAMFRNVADVTRTQLADVDLPAIFEALEPGPIDVPDSSLTLIVTPSRGWLSITNADWVELGRVAADDAELVATRRVDLRSRGRNTTASIEANVRRVPGILSVTIIANETSSIDTDSRPPKCFETVIWDEGTAPNVEIAQAIYDRKPPGAPAYGTTTTNAKTQSGEDFPIGFTRATVLRTYLAIEVAGGGASADQISDAIVARAKLLVVAESAGADEFYQAVRNALPTLGRVVSVKLGIAPTPTGTLVTARYSQIIRIDPDDITITGAS